MRDFTIDGATILAQIPNRRFTFLEAMPIPTLLTMFDETLGEIRGLPSDDMKAGAKRNGHAAIDKCLRGRGIDPVFEVCERARRRAEA